MWNPFFPGEAYDVNYIDPDTDEPIFSSSSGVREGFEMFREMHQIPGNADPEWVQSGHTAMSARYKSVGPLIDAESEGSLTWDMVSWPVFEDRRGVNPVQGGAAFGIASTTKHEDEAFQVLAYLLSDEFQTERVRDGLSTPLSDEEIKKQIYANEPSMADKNTGAFFL